MTDEIKQTANIGRVQPANPSRGSGQRKRRPPPPKPAADSRERSSDEDRPHQVDEYV